MEDVTFAGTTRQQEPGDARGVGGVLCGVPTSAGSPHSGAENGPYFLRRTSQHLVWGYDDAVVLSTDRLDAPAPWIDVGDLDVPADADASGVASIVRRHVEALPPGVAPGLIGGDHSITAGAVDALVRRHRDLVVVQLDHHLDVQVWQGDDLDGLFHTNVMSHVGRSLQPGHLIQLGIAPHVAVSQQALPAVTADLQRLGTQVSSVSPLLEDADAIEALVGAGRDVYVTVDVDVLDAAEMSSTGYPATVGLSLRRVLQLLRIVSRDNRLVGFDVVEFAADRSTRDPKTLADAGRAALLVAELIALTAHQPGEPRE